MDKYIKYPLPLRKDEINWELEYMKHGGSQLIEIMEKEFPLERIKDEKDELGINDNQIKRLESWIKHNTVCGKVQAEFGHRDSASAKSFFYRGAGILGRLLKTIKLTPIYVDGKFESKYSFIDYEVIENEIGTLVISRINKDKWCHSKVDKHAKSIIETKFYYRKNQNGGLTKIYETSPVAQKLKDMYDVTNLLSMQLV